MSSLGNLAPAVRPGASVFWSAQLDRVGIVDRLAIEMRAVLFGHDAEPWEESSGAQRDLWRGYARAALKVLGETKA